MPNLEQTQYGFNWGPMVVERLAADDRIGWVLIVRERDPRPGYGVPRQYQIRMSPKGRRMSIRGN